MRPAGVAGDIGATDCLCSAMQITTVVSGHRAKRDAFGNGRPVNPARRTCRANEHFVCLDRAPKNPPLDPGAAMLS
jgi:hypothetical protein